MHVRAPKWGSQTNDKPYNLKVYLFFSMKTSKNIFYRFKMQGKKPFFRKFQLRKNLDYNDKVWPQLKFFGKGVWGKNFFFKKGFSPVDFVSNLRAPKWGSFFVLLLYI